jgi:hypothetical protein
LQAGRGRVEADGKDAHGQCGSAEAPTTTRRRISGECQKGGAFSGAAMPGDRADLAAGTPGGPRMKTASLRAEGRARRGLRERAGGWWGADGVGWLITAAAAFTVAVAVFNPLSARLSGDEVVYASQIANHVPLLQWNPQHARGVSLLVAPVTLVTSSAVILRAYLAVLAGAGLLAALLAWRGVVRGRVLTLACVLFGGLWVAESLAVQLYPNYWIALGGLAGAGLCLRCLRAPAPGWLVLVLLAVTAAFTSLMRPQDAFFLFGPMLLAAVVVAARRPGRRRGVAALAAIVAGLAVGAGDWVAEGYLYFGGPLSRVHLTSRYVGGTRFSLLNSLRIIDGGRTSAVPGYPSVYGWPHPQLLWWWAAFALLAILGMWVAARTEGWAVAALPAACALGIYLLYTFPVRDNYRYLVPIWALLSIPAARGMAWLLTRWRHPARLAVVIVAVAFIAVELSAQHPLLMQHSAATQAGSQAEVRIMKSLRQLGVRPPCVVTSVYRPHFAPISEAAGFYTGCTYLCPVAGPTRGTGTGRLVALVQGMPPPRVQGSAPPWRYARSWGAHRLGAANVYAYLQPTGQPPLPLTRPRPHGHLAVCFPGPPAPGR